MITRRDCGRCRNGGKQCGAPMERWCQDPDKAKQGVSRNRILLYKLKNIINIYIT